MKTAIKPIQNNKYYGLQELNHNHFLLLLLLVIIMIRSESYDHNTSRYYNFFAWLTSLALAWIEYDNDAKQALAEMEFKDTILTLKWSCRCFVVKETSKRRGWLWILVLPNWSR